SSTDKERPPRLTGPFKDTAEQRKALFFDEASEVPNHGRLMVYPTEPSARRGSSFGAWSEQLHVYSQGQRSLDSTGVTSLRRECLGDRDPSGDDSIRALNSKSLQDSKRWRVILCNVLE